MFARREEVVKKTPGGEILTVDELKMLVLLRDHYLEETMKMEEESYINSSFAPSWYLPLISSVRVFCLSLTSYTVNLANVVFNLTLRKQFAYTN